VRNYRNCSVLYGTIVHSDNAQTQTHIEDCWFRFGFLQVFASHFLTRPSSIALRLVFFACLYILCFLGYCEFGCQYRCD